MRALKYPNYDCVITLDKNMSNPVQYKSNIISETLFASYLFGFYCMYISMAVKLGVNQESLFEGWFGPTNFLFIVIMSVTLLKLLTYTFLAEKIANGLYAIPLFAKLRGSLPLVMFKYD